MSASLVRKALDETRLECDEKLERLSKGSKKKFKPLKKKKMISKDKILKQNLKILKALDYKTPSRNKNKDLTPSFSQTYPAKEETNLSKKKKSKAKGKKQQQQGESCFTEEDFEKFEKEYFVTN